MLMGTPRSYIDNNEDLTITRIIITTIFKSTISYILSVLFHNSFV